MITAGFILTSLIVVLVPGTGVIYTVTEGLSGNRRRAVLAAFGCTLGIVPHIIAAVTGLSVIMNMSAHVMQLIKTAGICYLVYLGIGLLRTEGKIVFSEKSTARAGSVIAKAVLINLLNPKLTLFFLSFLPQFVVSDSISVKMQMTFLSLIFMALTFMIFCVYGLLANYFRLIICARPRIMKRVQQSFGVILIAFAGKLACDK